MGYIRVYHPQFHTDEAARWDSKREELRRWELTTNHWDLPIYQVATTKGR
jgi:hypothetical protein